MKDETGGTAFPFVSYGGRSEHQDCYPGMSLREYFAAKAMAALVTSGLNTGAWSDYADLAKSAYNIADEMIKARQE